jgi:hypothetical protein
MLIIRGIEVTQAIQYFRSDQHLDNSNDRRPDNSLTLIANKTAWVRVYVESDTPGTDIPNVTGRLEVNYGWMNQRWGQPGLFLNPHPQGTETVTAGFQPSYADVRGATERTLNFIIPYEWMFGPLVLKATVTDGGGHSAVQITEVSAILRQTLKVRGIMIGYDGPDLDNPGNTLTIPPPGLEDLQMMAEASLIVMPVRTEGVVEVASTLIRNVPLEGARGSDGECTVAWQALNEVVSAARAADGNRPGYLYYGLVCRGFPRDPNSPLGCRTGDVASGMMGEPIVMAHEIGHLCGRIHAPHGDVGIWDTGYPVYEPYPLGSIGEFGLLMVNGTVPTPDTAFDYMAYSERPWISIHGHQRLLQISELNPEIVGLRRRSQWWRNWYHAEEDPAWLNAELSPDWIDSHQVPLRLQKVITVIGVIGPEDRVEVLSVTRSEVFSTQIKGIATDSRVVLYGPKSVELASGALFELPSLGMGGFGGAAQSRPTMFQAFVPDVETGTELSIRQKGKTLWKRAAPAGDVLVSAPKIQKSKDGKWTVTWKATVPGGAKDAWVRVSADDGKSWRAVATGLTKNRATFEAVRVPAGKLLIDVLVHDGFRSISSEPVAFENGVVPPVPAIMYPQKGRMLVEGETLCLWGSVAGQPGRSLDGLRYSWTLDGQPAGDKRQVFMAVPKPGTHRCEFAVRSATGEILASRSVEFVSLSPEDGEKL